MFGIAILGLKAYTIYCLCVYLQASVQLTLLFPPCSIYCTITVEAEIQDGFSPPFLYLNISMKWVQISIDVAVSKSEVHDTGPQKLQNQNATKVLWTDNLIERKPDPIKSNKMVS